MTTTPNLHRQRKGAVAYQFGQSAEDQVLRHYQSAGLLLLHRRWRGRGGEIDLILQDRETIVFVEVKAASSIQSAITRLGPPQMRRIHAAAEEFIGTLPSGSLTEVRFDLACVDKTGAPQIMENCFSHF